MFPHSILLSGWTKHFPLIPQGAGWKQPLHRQVALKHQQSQETPPPSSLPQPQGEQSSLPLTSVPEHQRPLLPPAARGGGAVLGRRPGAARGRGGRRGRGSSRRREPHVVIPAAGKPGSGHRDTQPDSCSGQGKDPKHLARPGRHPSRLLSQQGAPPGRIQGLHCGTSLMDTCSVFPTAFLWEVYPGDSRESCGTAQPPHHPRGTRGGHFAPSRDEIPQNCALG